MTDKYKLITDKPILLVGGGPVGLMTALGLSRMGIPVKLFEDDGTFSSDTKAGTTLTRTLEISRRYGGVERILSNALRVGEIGEIDRVSGTTSFVDNAILANDTRFPYVINLPQHLLEPLLAEELYTRDCCEIFMNHKCVSFEQNEDGVSATFDTPDGQVVHEGCYLIACDGSRSMIRNNLGIKIDGHTLDVRYMLIDFNVDLDVKNFRDFPYLCYHRDENEWMISIRHPHCWRFLYPNKTTEDEPTQEELEAKVRKFIGDVDEVEMLNYISYHVHHRVAEKFRHKRVFLVGDSAHLVTPMWALGMNTGMLDASNLPWRLAWVLRGWAPESLLDGYDTEQRPVAVRGSGEMAEAARKYMEGQGEEIVSISDGEWGRAYTRTLLGVRLDVDNSGNWSMVKTGETPDALTPGDRLPDYSVAGPTGSPMRLHDVIDGKFTALYLTDSRRKPNIPANDKESLQHIIVSRYDAPLDSGLREQSLLDVGDAFLNRAGCELGTLILVRPDEHIAAIVPFDENTSAEVLYKKITGASEIS